MLTEIQTRCVYTNVIYTGHALKRMDERYITERDVNAALKSATAAVADTAKPGCYRVTGGFGTDGEPISIVVALPGLDLKVITVLDAS